MAQFSKKKKEHIGLSPYALVFRGQQKTDRLRVRSLVFDAETVKESEELTFAGIEEFRKSDKRAWVNVDGLHDEKWMEEIAGTFGIDKAVLSEVMNPGARPRVHEFNKGLYVSLKMLQYEEKTSHVTAENLSLIITDRVIVSFQEKAGHVFDPVRERIRKHHHKIRVSGTDYLAFALLDVVVDNYIYIMGLLGEKIESLEDQITLNPEKTLLEEINQYKIELNFIRKCIKPAREMILNLIKIDSDYIQHQNHQHFRELQDNIAEATELTDSYREILFDQLSIYHSSMSTKLSEIMRILTVYSVIFIPLTFIVGVYGTNFTYLPEKDWHYGYFVMWIVMVLVSVVLLWFFKRKKYL